MDNFVDTVWISNPKYAAAIIGATVVGGVLLYKLLWRSNKLPASTKNPKDTVVLHQLGRGPWVPSMTPFAVKLETFLRMANIPYVNAHDMKTSPKGKFPWIEYNEEIVADTHFCIQYLNKKLNKDLNSHLTAEQRAIGRAFQKMAEENLYWTSVLYRWYYDTETKALSFFPIPGFMKWILKRYMRNKYKKMADSQGLGRHTEEELHSIMMGDLQALSDFIGNKKFMFGDQHCEIDCAIFGQLSQMRWQMFGNPPEAAVEKFPNLCNYLETMRNTFWPDWDDCITHGGTKTATK